MKEKILLSRRGTASKISGVWPGSEGSFVHFVLVRFLGWLIPVGRWLVVLEMIIWWVIIWSLSVDLSSKPVQDIGGGWWPDMGNTFEQVTQNIEEVVNSQYSGNKLAPC